MKLEFKANQLKFNAEAYLATLRQIYDLYLNDLSQQLVDIVRNEIMKNGNGSSIMKLTAYSEVKETKREIANEEITLEVGFDMNEMKSRSEAIFVRVSVVLHGNVRDGEILYTKPGQMTWTKHVGYKRMSPAETVYALPDGFNQHDKMDDIVRGIEQNTEKSMARHVKTFISNVNKAIRGINLSAFLEVG